MARKPNTGAGGSGARQVSKCSGKNGPVNRSIANFSQEHRAENFDARQPRPSATSRPRPHRRGDLNPSEPLVITLESRGGDKFDALFNGRRIIAASRQPIGEAARALHHLGYADELVLVVWHRGANHEAIRGPLGVWRRLRIRDGRGGPRFAKWEPFPLRPVQAKKGHTEAKAVGPRGGRKNAPAAAPGAREGWSPAPVTVTSDSEGRSDA
jgi:hypothetical protein